jgi:outer membrane murein-binding lipoprotein Lpp
MNKTLEQLVGLLPDGFSETGMDEIGTLVESMVQERVESEVKELEARVSGYLRMKVNELKEQALKELENEDATFRAVKVYEALKSVVAEDIESQDTESAVSVYKAENSKLEETVESLNAKVSQLISENNTLEDSVTYLREDVENLSEVKKAPFKSSEQALVITNEAANERSVSTPETSNAFLTEDVMRLSHLINS